MRYAFFPQARRLAIQHGGAVRVYDTGDNNFSGFSQQQGGDQSLTFTSQYGVVRVADLPMVSRGDEQSPSTPPAGARPYSPEPPAPEFSAPQPPAPVFSPPQAAAAAPASGSPAAAADDILKTIERLAELRQKGVLTDEEFAAKKADLLSRL